MQKEEDHEEDGEAGDDDLDRDVEQGKPSGGGALAVPLVLGHVHQGQAARRGGSAASHVLGDAEHGHDSKGGPDEVLFLQRGGGGPLNNLEVTKVIIRLTKRSAFIPPF